MEKPKKASHLAYGIFQRGFFMEQKKTLWIIAATGIFLLVVVGAALILYSPSLHQPSGLQAGFDPSSGWISSTKTSVTPIQDSTLSFNTETPAETEKTSATNNDLTLSPFVNSANSEASKPAQNSENFVRADKLTVISDNATVYSTGTTTIDLNSLKSSPNGGIIAKNERTASQINSNRIAEPLPPPPVREETVTENYYAPPAPVAKAAPAPKATAQAPKASTPAKSTSTAKAPAKTSTKSTATASAKPTKSATAAKVASTAKKAPDSFWVQAAAYTSKRNADEARTTLESNKIPSEVFTFTDSNGKTFYRVRVGPYVTKSEAEYWQTRIGMIDKFASSKSVIVNIAIN